MAAAELRLLALGLLSVAMLVSFGDSSLVALLSLLAAVAVAAWSLRSRSAGWHPVAGRMALLSAGLATTGVLYGGRFPTPVFAATAGVVVGCIALVCWCPVRWMRTLAASTALIAWTGSALAAITWGSAPADVFAFQQNASWALAHGQNPYTTVTDAVTAVQVSGSHVLGVATPMHFPYGPVIPMLEVPFRLLGDVRVLHGLAALATLAAVLVIGRRAGGTQRALLVAMAFPLSAGLVLVSWVDAITMAALAIWFALLRSHPRTATVMLALALATKPTALVALVPMLFWSLRARRQMVWACSGAAAIAVPFAVITGFAQFWFDVIGVQASLPPRMDALTLDSALNAAALPMLPFAVSAGVIALTAWLVLHRRPQTYGDVLTATAVLAAVSLLVAKWAYFNYYYIVAVLLMLAVAADDLKLDTPDMVRPPALLAWVRAALTPARAAPSLSA